MVRCAARLQQPLAFARLSWSAASPPADAEHDRHCPLHSETSGRGEGKVEGGQPHHAAQVGRTYVWLRGLTRTVTQLCAGRARPAHRPGDLNISREMDMASSTRASSGPLPISQIVGMANPSPLPPTDLSAANLPPNYERCVFGSWVAGRGGSRACGAWQGDCGSLSAGVGCTSRVHRAWRAAH